MTKAEFFKLCQDHDWYYEFSDDHRVWRAGVENVKKLIQLTKDQPELEPVFIAWREYVFGGPTFGRPEAPKPVLENFI